ncbi:MAG: hypothetical protein JJU16_02420 [Alkalibacterium sp.]|nr:hypothetical protein [Alkalibacterium sp.]
MELKKLIGLLAVSTLALAACDADTDEEPSPDPDIEEGTEGADEVEDDSTEDDAAEDDATDEDDADGEGQSAHDIIDGIGSDLGYTSSIELEVTGGTWSQDGYVFTPEDGEATVNGSAAAGEDVDVYAFVLQDGEVVEKPEVEEGAFTFTATASEGDQDYQVGVSDEDLWEVGDEADPEELVRYENVIILAPGE